MRERVLKHNLWEHDAGDRIRGYFIETRYVILKNDTMIFDYGKRKKDTTINYSLAVKGKVEWYDLKEIVRGNSFKNENISLKKDTVIRKPVYVPNDTLILLHQYFSTMVVMDPKTKKVGKYTMKGANWFNYLFR